MSITTLAQSYNYAVVADTPAVAAGVALLPGLVDVHGNVYSVVSGNLRGVANGGALLFAAMPSQGDQKIIADGIGGNGDLSVMVHYDPATGKGIQVAYIPSENIITIDRLDPTAGTTDVRINNISPVSKSTNRGGELNRLIVSIIGGVVSVAQFDMTTPQAGQPGNPLNPTDVGANGFYTYTETTLTAPGQYALNTSVTGDLLATSLIQLFGSSLPPAAPGALTRTALLASAALAWPAVTGANGYRVRKDGVTTPIYDGAGLTFTDTFALGTSHTYTVAAYNGGGESTLTAPITVTALTTSLSLTVTPATGANNLAWLSDSLAVNGYAVLWMPGSALPVVGATGEVVGKVAQGTLTWSDTSAYRIALSAGSRYEIISLH